jgi:hypothetical protein
MAVKKNQHIEGLVPKGQDPPDMGSVSDLPKNETLRRSSAKGRITGIPGAEKYVDPNARRGKYHN